MSLQKSFCQVPDSLKTISDTSYTITEGLIEGLRYKELYFNEVSKDSFQDSIISTKDKIIEVQERTIKALTVIANETPAFIKEHDWLTTGIVLGLVTVVEILLYFQIK